MENIEVLRQNGFEIEVDEAASVGQGSKLHLIAKPTSGSTDFDMKGRPSQLVIQTCVLTFRIDLEEIVHLMRDRPAGQIVRCSKVRTMFAMRACRKSVMIGMPLSPQHMMTVSVTFHLFFCLELIWYISQVIRHMGTIDQPWNCPHGRPTMRHLLDMRSSGRRQHEHPRLIDWSGF